jgi:hypothetical protein
MSRQTQGKKNKHRRRSGVAAFVQHASRHQGIDTTLDDINSQIARTLTWLCWREQSLALCFMTITSAVVNRYLSGQLKGDRRDARPSRDHSCLHSRSLGFKALFVFFRKLVVLL